MSHLKPSISYKLPANWLFAQQLVQVNNKKAPKLHIADPLWGESTGDGGFQSQSGKHSM